MLATPEPCAATVWHASACLDDGSWNQAVLELPLEDTPMGTQLGAALICDRAFGDQNNMSPINISAPTAKSPALLVLIFHLR